MNAITAFETEMNRLIVWAFAVELITLVVTLFLLYLVIKAAIRDGIRDSGIIEAMHKRQISTLHIPEAGADR